MNVLGMCGRAVESGGSTRNSREDLYGSRNYRGSNSSLNDGRFHSFSLSEFVLSLAV